MKNEKLLDPVELDSRFADYIEKYLDKFFLKEIYQPLMGELRDYRKIQNSELDLLKAIQSGRVNYYRGYFTGKFNAYTSRALKKMGATWSSKNGGSFRLLSSSLPQAVSMAVKTAESSWLKKNDIIQRKLKEIEGIDIAKAIDLRGIIDKALFNLDKDLNKSFQGLVVAPKLSKQNISDISENYTENMQYYIQEFTEKEVVSLREKVKENVFSGQRYEGMVKIIERSYGVSKSKASFLAKQETNLLVAKFKESRYNEAGVDDYIWQTVVGSDKHPVREKHKMLNGTRQKFSKPPIVNAKGDRKNPKEDYNCRCTARPIVRF